MCLTGSGKEDGKDYLIEKKGALQTDTHSI